jgi:proteasome lid subunit RPN8/RPN11
MLVCDIGVIDCTLAHMLAGGARRTETVILWLGRRSESTEEVSGAFRPTQIVSQDSFRIPPQAMRELLAYLRKERLHVLAQVHSHPAAAYHSDADNRWAIVRHCGAISLVIPWFGKRTTALSFQDDVAAFQLDPSDTWRKMDPRLVLEVRR